jgi:hypothetical protein
VNDMKPFFIVGLSSFLFVLASLNSILAQLHNGHHSDPLKFILGPSSQVPTLDFLNAVVFFNEDDLSFIFCPLFLTEN